LMNYPELTVGQLKPHHVEKWAACGVRTVNTRRNLMRAVKRCLKWAKSQGYIEKNPIADLEIPSATAKEVFISREEFSVLMSHVPNTALAELLTVTYEVGCRPQESLRLEARHVDLEKSRWIFPASESKGKHSPRVVYLTEKAAAITAKLVEAYPRGKLFRNSHGNPWTVDSIGSQFSRLQIRMGKQQLKKLDVEFSDKEVSDFSQKLCPNLTEKKKVRMKTKSELKQEALRKMSDLKACELASRYSLYALRHSWATNALHTVDSLTVAVLMGHKDPSTLARTYQHLSHNPEHLLQQARLAAG